MQVETFEVTEIGQEGEIQDCEQVKKLVEELGLEGQKSFFEEGVKEVFPYRKMTAQEMLVYGTLCPEKTDLEKYREHVIPLRVLQVASHALQTGLIKKIQVWYPNSSDIKDPVLVGMENPDSWSNKGWFLLARWGEVLEAFPILCEQAKKVLLNMAKASARKVESEIASATSGLEEKVNAAFDNGKRIQFSFYES